MAHDFYQEEFNSNSFPKGVPKGEYESCRFVGIDLSQADLSGLKLIDCDFIECNLSGVRWSHTSMEETRFVRCKMLGVHFELVSEYGFEASFDSCVLDQSSFYKMQLGRVSFNDCKMRDTDIAEANLKGTSITNCDLQGANFDQTNLEGADFTGSFHYQIDPEKNRVKGAKFSRDSIEGLLGRYQVKIV